MNGCASGLLVHGGLLLYMLRSIAGVSLLKNFSISCGCGTAQELELSPVTMRRARFLLRRYDLCIKAGSFVFGGALLGGRSVNLFSFILSWANRVISSTMSSNSSHRLSSKLSSKSLSCGRNLLVGASLSGFGIKSSLACCQSLAFTSFSSFSSTPSVSSSLISDCGWVELMLFCVSAGILLSDLVLAWLWPVLNSSCDAGFGLLLLACRRGIAGLPGFVLVFLLGGRGAFDPLFRLFLSLLVRETACAVVHLLRLSWFLTLVGFAKVLGHQRHLN